VSITVDDLTHRYRSTTVIDSLSCEINSGVTAVVGPNGAGKSTLLRILATIEPCQNEESVSIAGLRPSRGNARLIRRRMGYLPQAFTFDGRFSVQDFVSYVACLKGVAPTLVPRQVNLALRTVGLEDRAQMRLNALSGGMIRRAGIAQAIVNDPDVVILDEPTAGLDSRQRQGFRDLIARIASQERLVLFSTHMTEDLLLTAERLLVMDKGRIVWAGTLHELVGSGSRDTQMIEQALASHLSPEMKEG